MNALDATRKWLREKCPLIDKNNRFNANYLGASGVEYTLRTSGEKHRQNIVGDDIATHDLVFEAQLPFGTALAPNLAAADFFAGLSSWVRGQAACGQYPEINGYEVTELTASNAGVITSATATDARYLLQLQLVMKERT